MSEDFDECMNNYFAKLSELKKRTMATRLDYIAYQKLLRDVNDLEKNGTRKFTIYLQAAREQQSYTLSNQIEEVILKWQNDTDDLLKLLHRKSPSH